MNVKPIGTFWMNEWMNEWMNTEWMNVPNAASAPFLRTFEIFYVVPLPVPNAAYLYRYLMLLHRFLYR